MRLLFDPDGEPLRAADCVVEADCTRETVVIVEADCVAAITDGVTFTENVPLDEALAELETDDDGVSLGVDLLVFEDEVDAVCVMLFDVTALAVTERVCEIDPVLSVVRDGTAEEVFNAVPEREGDDDADSEGETGGEPVDDREIRGETDDDIMPLGDAVVMVDFVELADIELRTVTVELREAVGETEETVDGELETEGDTDTFAEMVPFIFDTLAEKLAEALVVEDVVPIWLLLKDTEILTVGVAELVLDTEAEADTVAFMVAAADDVSVTV